MVERIERLHVASEAREEKILAVHRRVVVVGATLLDQSDIRSTRPRGKDKSNVR
jgi:hypothetical protein